MYKIIGADGKEYGPVTADQIRRWMGEGRVNAQTKVRLEGTTDWRPLIDFPEFIQAKGAPGIPEYAGAPAPGMPAGDALAKVNGPATALIVVAALNFLAACLSLLFSFAGRSFLSEAHLPEETWAMLSGTLTILSNVLVLLLSGFILYGALQMKQLGSYSLAMTAAILAAVPCTSPCCIVGLPVGIWALVVLNKPEVKSAFKS